ncbi:MAG: GatB/YqeY domain-containing protein [Fermentimonas sp.]|nr:GatB/YqeY domain-containing protein [Fermentimonas sp.]
MKLFDIITEEIKKAMLAKDRVRLDALRGAKKEFIEAKTAKGGGDELSDDKAISILQRMVKQRKESAEIYSQQNRSDLAETEIEQMNVIQEFLPAQLSTDEIESIVKKVILDTEASSMKDMGKVMAIATKELAGKAEGGVISGIVRKLLS